MLTLNKSEEKCLENQRNWQSKHQVFRAIYDKEHKPNQEYWHYTSLKGVLGIFKDYVETCFDDEYVKKCNLYASNIRYMNDLQEYREGIDAYEKRSNKKHDPDMDDDIYLISFCGNGDLLSQWKWYGKNSGLAICFDLDCIKYNTFSYVDEKGKVIESKQYYDENTKPVDVRYTNNQKSKLYNMLSKDSCIAKSDATQLIQQTFVPFCKDEGFKEEKESRLVFYVTDLVGNSKCRPKFNVIYNTAEEGRIKPALNVGLSLIDNSNPAVIKKNIINRIVVGPGENQELVFNAAIHLFDRKNYKFHENGEEDKNELEWNDFINICDHKSHIVKCHDKKNRVAYLCENGIAIIRSSIPFRG